MSRIGKQPILLPEGVEATKDGHAVVVTGSKGTLRRELTDRVTVDVDGGTVTVKRKDDSHESRSLHGLTRTLIANMVTGVHAGFTKELDLVGVGYRASMAGRDLVLTLGYSHPIRYTPPEHITLATPTATRIVVTGPDKEVVGLVAARLRAFRKPEPYKGKGVMYVGEKIRRKAGKSGKAGKGK